MKRLVFLFAIAFMAGTVAMAQGRRRGEKMPDAKERAERMTDRMVKEYSLNDKQKQKLLELNTEMMGKMSEAPAIHRNKGKKGEKPECNCNCVHKKEVAKKRDKAPKADAANKEFREAYDAKLKDIMDKKQYEAYSKKKTEREQKIKERLEKKKS